MIFRSLAIPVIALIFSSSMVFNFSQNGNSNLNASSSSVPNQSLALFMPADSRIITDVVSSNDESC